MEIVYRCWIPAECDEQGARATVAPDNESWTAAELFAAHRLQEQRAKGEVVDVQGVTVRVRCPSRLLLDFDVVFKTEITARTTDSRVVYRPGAKGER